MDVQSADPAQTAPIIVPKNMRKKKDHADAYIIYANSFIKTVSAKSLGL